MIDLLPLQLQVAVRDVEQRLLHTLIGHPLSELLQLPGLLLGPGRHRLGVHVDAQIDDLQRLSAHRRLVPGGLDLLHGRVHLVTAHQHEP
ncbi:hypothetical protein Svir_36360 [Saccharomonospora viridis DSM 43017]|uniref:Uncharacterized protein n=1 Tax=Saccharomonospora viridis (strain ATCC 15386 / DSM 43017 / JCM 3036 / CCUG 5913 / NBRC 12207 / NCIMB 9602 / P101) TaxID=471857 RepID=C7MQR2_SACVD|nr:hypothetical protein Svir_36360 [Saccharomonospora viridis DSM 43017]